MDLTNLTLDELLAQIKADSGYKEPVKEEKTELTSEPAKEETVEAVETNEEPEVVEATEEFEATAEPEIIEAVEEEPEEEPSTEPAPMTADQRTVLTAAVNAAKAVYGQVTAVQKQRMENQLGLWATAKSHI